VRTQKSYKNPNNNEISPPSNYSKHGYNTRQSKTGDWNVNITPVKPPLPETLRMPLGLNARLTSTASTSIPVTASDTSFTQHDPFCRLSDEETAESFPFHVLSNGQEWYNCLDQSTRTSLTRIRETIFREVQ
jgi:hypothetical protein